MQQSDAINEDTGVQAGGRGSDSNNSTISEAVNSIRNDLHDIVEILEYFRNMISGRNLNFIRLTLFLIIVFVLVALAAISHYIFARV